MQDILIHPDLSHLTVDQTEVLAARYYAGEKIAVLRREFQIKGEQRNLHKLLPPMINKIYACPNCGGKLILPRGHRNIRPAQESSDSWRCVQCNHKEHYVCRCAYCSPPYTQIIRPEHLTLEQVFSMLALYFCFNQNCARSAAITDVYANPVIPFAPQGRYGYRLLEQLVDKKVITKATPSDDVFSFHGMKLIIEQPLAYKWKISSDRRFVFFYELTEHIAKKQWRDQWLAQIPDFLLSLAYAECQEFYDWCAKQRHFPIADESSIEQMLSHLLQEFSVAQCTYIIFESAKSAADHLRTTLCSPLTASSYMLSECRRWLAEAKTDNHNRVVPTLERNPELPRSMINQVFHNYFLESDNDYVFALPLEKIHLPP